MRPPTTICNGCTRYVNAVATPKLPPPPRRAQKRSGCDVGAHVQHLTGRRHELDGDEVVGSEAVLRHQPAEPAAERVPADPGRRDRPAGDRESMLGRRVVELAPQDAALRAKGLRGRIDVDPLHLGEVDHDAAVRDSTAGDVVAAAANGHLEPCLTGDREGGDDVGRSMRPNDHRRPFVDEPVVDGADCVVARVVRCEHGTRDPSR